MINWKTTVAGIIAGAIPILQGISDSMGAGVPIKWAPIVMGLAIMVLGVVAKDWTKAPPAALVLVIALPLLNGCSMSLERARAAGITARLRAAPKAAPASRAECDALDKTQRYWGYAGDATGPAGILAGSLAAVPGVDGKAQSALLVTAGVAAAVTVFEFAEQGNFSRQWVEQGCGQ